MDGHAKKRAPVHAPTNIVGIERAADRAGADRCGRGHPLGHQQAGQP